MSTRRLPKADWLGIHSLLPALLHALRAPEDAWNQYQQRRLFQANLDRFYSDLKEQLTTTKPNLGRFFTSKVTRAKVRNSPLLPVYLDLKRRAERGETATQMFQPYLPATHMMLIEAAENSSKLHSGVEDAQFALRWSLKIRNLIMSKLAFPGVMVLAMLAAYVGLMGGWLYPLLTSSAPQLPVGPTVKFAMWSAATIRHHPVMCVSLLLVLARLVQATFTEATGEFRAWLDGFLPWRIFRDLSAGKFFLKLSPMMSMGGTTLSTVLEKIAGTANRYERFHFYQMIQSVGRGEGSTKSLDTGFIPPDMIDRIYTFEDSGQWNFILREIGRSTFQETFDMLESSLSKASFILLSTAYIMFVVIFTATFSFFDLDSISSNAAATPAAATVQK